MEKLSRTQRHETIRNDQADQQNNENNQPLNQNQSNFGVFNQNQAPEPNPYTQASNQPFNPFAQQTTQPFNPFTQPAAPVQPVNPFGQPANQVNNPFAQSSAPASQPTQPVQPVVPVQPTSPFNQTFNPFEKPAAPVQPVNPFGQPANQVNNPFAQSSAPASQPTQPIQPSHNDEFLKSVINDAKQYGINQGERTQYDTQANTIDKMVNKGVVPPLPQAPIINQPLPNVGVKEFNPNQFGFDVGDTSEKDRIFENTVRIEAKHIQESAGTITLEEQVASLLNPTGFNKPTAPAQTQPAETKVTFEQNIPFTGVASVKPTEEVVKEDENPSFNTGRLPVIGQQVTTTVAGSSLESDLDEALKNRIIDQTQQIQNRINEYDKELDGVNGSVNYNNRVLNIILVFLILGLTVVLAVVIYWILNVRNII